MTSYRIYIRISGVEFMAERFQCESSLPEAGSFGKIKDMHSPIQELGAYWLSDALNMQIFDDDIIHDYVARYVAGCIESRGYGAELVSLVIVALYAGEEDLRGIYVSNQIIDLLYKARASIDIDQYIQPLSGET